MKRALFLDRDGTINRVVFYPQTNEYDSPQKPDDVRLIDGIAQVIRWANKHHIPVLEVSNQPGIAKGKMTTEVCLSIDERVYQLLKAKGAKIDRSYLCLHHPLGTVPELTIECSCRKPKPGLLIRASREFNLDLTKSIILGDGAVDITAGRSVGCKTVLLLNPENDPQSVKDALAVETDHKIKFISEAVPILEQYFKN